MTGFRKRRFQEQAAPWCRGTEGLRSTQRQPHWTAPMAGSAHPVVDDGAREAHSGQQLTHASGVGCEAHLGEILSSQFLITGA